MHFQTSQKSIFDTFLAATSETTLDSAPIPPTQETIEQQKGDEEEEVGEKQDTVQTDEPEPITAETDTPNEDDFIEKPDYDNSPSLPDDFHYDSEVIHAKPLITDHNIFPANTLSL